MGAVRVLALALILISAALLAVTRTAVAARRPAGAGHRIAGAAPAAVTSGQAQVVAPVAAGQLVPLTLVLRAPHSDQLAQLANAVVNPNSQSFHHFLSFDQFKRQFAPSERQVASVESWARHNGLAVRHAYGNNLAVAVAGTAGAVDRAFGVKLNDYQVGNRRFFSANRDPVIPQQVGELVQDVEGLSSFVQLTSATGSPVPSQASPSFRPGPFEQVQTADRSRVTARSTNRGAAEAVPNICCGQAGLGVELPDLYSSEAYDYAALQRFSPCCNPTRVSGGTPKESSIAVIGTNTIDLNDLNTFASQYGMATALTEDKINDPACCDGEMTADIETATAMANSFGSFADTAHVYAYQGGGTKLSDLLDAWEAAHSSDQARVATTSFGAPEDNYGGVGNPSISDFSEIINAMTAEGWTIAAASGDHGAYDDCQNLSVDYPASNPNVVAVGGTTLVLNTNGGKPQFSSEAAWTGTGCGGSTFPGANNGGGGGGCASTEPAGFWQPIVSSLPCGNKRAVPDLALNASTSVAGAGVALYWLGKWQSIGGTSIATPEFAAFVARLNAYLLSLGDICGASFSDPCAPLGMPNAMLWLMGNAASAPNLHDPFYDVTSGCNAGSQGQGYCAGPGYDLASGWGSFNALQLAWGLIDDVSHGVIPEITFSGPAGGPWFNNDRRVDFSIVSPDPQGTTASVGLAGYTAQWDKPIDDVLKHATPGSGDSFYDGPPTQGSRGSLGLESAGTGCHTAHVRAWDNAGETSDDETFGPICLDNKPPDVFCASADDAWHADNITVNCAAIDQSDLSGLANPSDSSFTLETTVAPGFETDNAFTGSHQVCDVAGNCVTAGPIGPIKVDRAAPSISITSPTATNYTVNQVVPAGYSCSDGGSGVATCTGKVANGSPIDTVAVGSKTFTVSSTDNVANASTQTVSYGVTYKICLKYDPSVPSGGRPYIFKLQLCDADSKNISMKSIAVTATAVDGDPSKAVPLGNSNPGNRFAYGPPTSPGASYQYKLDTSHMKAGAHALTFTVAGDPVAHTAPFVLKK